MVIHEPTSTEAPEDIGHHDHVEDDAVLPQIEHQQVSSPVLTHSKLISIGRPLTPTAQDASWPDHPQRQGTPSSPRPRATPTVQDDDDFAAQHTPSPQASPALRRLRKGPRPQVPLSSIPEGEVRHPSVARQVFPEATPTVNVSVSEAQAVEDNLAASADDEHQEERVPTSPFLKKLFMM